MLHVKRRAFIVLIGAAAIAWPLAAALLAAGISATGPASAQTYPSRPITLVVPYPPGGATDAIARIIQDSMSQSLGQQIVVENIGGAGGMVAAGRAARAAPDGYTVLLHQVALAAGMTLYPNLAFDAEKDFVPIGLINTAASTLAARPTLPPNDIAELVRWMKAPGQNVKIAHPGVGSFGHLAGVLVAEEIGATVTQVPYRGAGPALNDLLASVADLSSISAVVAGPLVKAGKIKAYAIIGRTRFAGLPELPTMGEVGYKKLDLDFWHMLLAPAGTPRPIVERLNKELRALVDTDAVRQRIQAEGGDAMTSSPDEYARDIDLEETKWGTLIRKLNLKVE